LIALKLRTSSSFQAVSKSSVIFQEFQETSLQTAAPSTILWWVRKLGYYALTKPKPVADDWVILLDHTIQLGAEKLCVILGLRESLIDFRRPLQYEDLEPLWMSSSARWNGDFIHEILERLQRKLGRIKYAVADYGSDIRKGLRLAGISHIHDVTHRIALSLKRLYADDPSYQDVSQRLTLIRQQFGQTVAAHLLPPNQRTKSRYHNLLPLAAYGRHMLTYLNRPHEAVPEDGAFRDAMAWIREYQAFFAEMNEVTTVVCEVERLVKWHGLSAFTLAQCCQRLAQVSTDKGMQFKFDILVYFHMTLALPRVFDTIVCTSDILESAFGKYKNYVSCNPMAGITDLALCIAAFTCSLTPQEIAEALEHVREHDVTRWARVYLGPTLLKKRRQAFSESQK
jgi:hypothetical protein